MTSIYFDNNATTATDERVIEAMMTCMREGHANPASQHQAGQHARSILEDARQLVAQCLGTRFGGTSNDQVVFTSGGTEANNLVLRGIAENRGGNIVTSSIEHPSVVAATEYLKARGTDVRHMDVTADGVISISQLESLMDSETRLVSVMLANNETGAIQPIRDVSAICRSRGVPCHTDAVQAVGKIPVNFSDLGVDAMTVAPHKFHGPLGIGILVLRHSLTLQPLLHGGFQQLGLRPGTESVALAVGAARSLELARNELTSRATRMSTLRQQFEHDLLAHLPNIVVHGETVDRIPQTSSISFLGVDRQSLLLALDMAGIACSTGSACASGSSEPSPTLVAMGRSQAEISSALRFSMSAFTTESEIEQAVSRIIKCVNNLRSREQTRKEASTPRTTGGKAL